MEGGGETYNHAESDLLSTVLLFHRLVHDNVQEDLFQLAKKFRKYRRCLTS
jgi:hypothetical protein